MLKFLNFLLSHNPQTKEDLEKLKRELANKFKIPVPSNRKILYWYKKFLNKGKIKENNVFLNLLRIRKIRTLSGVAPLTVLTKPYPCPGKCIYCPVQQKMPKSYLKSEPAAARAYNLKFSPHFQVAHRLLSYYQNGHFPEKIELIILGGTWSYYPKKYQTWFINRCFQSLNTFRYDLENNGFKIKIQNKSLKDVQKTNEKAKHRMIGLTIETRPDFISIKEIKRLRKLGVTRVEIGVQSIYDDILKLNLRMHKVKEIINATYLLKQAGFKVMYHMMPNLYGSTFEKDIKMFDVLFKDQRFRPDQLKIYPCIVLPNSELYNLYKAGKYVPYNNQTLIKLLIEIKKLIPEYVRIERLIRDIPSFEIFAGNKFTNLRMIVQEKMRNIGVTCKCIRCREIRENLPKGRIKLKILRYQASFGEEFFLSYVDESDKILGFLRLRINSKDGFLPPPLNSATIIRELHIYGIQVPITKFEEGIQHKGLGKKLIKKAEEISKKLGYKKIAVISGIGVRDYYRKLGYRLENSWFYMLKHL